MVKVLNLVFPKEKKNRISIQKLKIKIFPKTKNQVFLSKFNSLQNSYNQVSLPKSQNRIFQQNGKSKFFVKIAKTDFPQKTKKK